MPLDNARIDVNAKKSVNFVTVAGVKGVVMRSLRQLLTCGVSLVPAILGKLWNVLLRNEGLRSSGSSVAK